MEAVLGWGSPIGLGMILLGLGVFFWGLHHIPQSMWRKKWGQDKD